MGVIVLLRKEKLVNRFRDIMIRTIESGAGDNILLCSGFFQEVFKTSVYRASNEMRLAQKLAAKNIQVTTVGIHHPSWLPSYRNFRDALQASGVNVTARFTGSFHWHAKIYIYSKGQRPLLGIIGSSNITRNAFSSSNDSLPFNFESDVVLWDSSHNRVNRLMERVFNDVADPHEVIRARYIKKWNNNLTESERLAQLRDELLHLPLGDLK